MSPSVVSTVVDYVSHDILKRPSWASRKSNAQVVTPIISSQATATELELETHAPSSSAGFVQRDENALEEDPELRLPSRGSLFVMIATNALLQFGFFVTVSSAASYAEYLGGTAVFSGLTIGIPTVFSGMALIPMTRFDEGRYTRPLLLAFIALFLGNIFHAVAYPTHFLYFILIGRIVSGVAFTGFMYTKRFCSDPRIIGIRRRTTLASWLVLGQAFGFSVGPFIGGALYKIGFKNNVFNGFTSTGWVTAAFTVIFAVWSFRLFQDVPKPTRISDQASLEAPPVAPHPDDYGFTQLSLQQWGVLFSMCWASMTCFFILGSWEANIPIFTASAPAFHYSPYAAGNFIALGGIATLPFLLANVRYAPRFQDRTTLLLGTGIGFLGLLLTLVLLARDNVAVAPFYICWVLVALGFNLGSTCTFSLLSKQFPNSWNGRTSMMIQYSNYCGRVTGAVLGGAGVQIGMKKYIAIQMGVVGVGTLLHLTFWRQLKAKTG
ncbi:hypothetical protein MIND_00586800 [Mycena indigotica]|uniref:MFS general substrate transporter n=1 Tax=Mycena indigotica TaxID=2126181 RepID=A0A8H6SPE9_9AGAR|nr:uncharacterized protein MIND_00586800 [Mycena indigotica]KAF7303575.1 hypothetical protein MIND_00586800 [Mycena indigotica]